VKAVRKRARQAIDAAATLTDKRFGLLVASSALATSVIVAAAMTSSSSFGPLAELLGRSLAASDVPAETAPAEPEELEESEAAPGSAPESGEPTESLAPEPEGPSGPAPEPEGPSGPAPEPEEEAPLPEVPLPEAGQIKHVFLISLAGPGYEAAFGTESTMPYLAGTLRPKGVLLSGYSLLADSTLANSIAAISGQPPNAKTKQDCTTYDEFPATASVNKQGVVAGSGCVYPVTTLTFADQLGSGRFTWRAYMEGMTDASGKPDNCVHPEPGAAETASGGGYSARLNPFAYFHSLLDLGDCSTNDVPATSLAKDLKKKTTTSNFSYIAPNLCNAGVAGQCPQGSPEGAAAADAYLATLVPQILASPAYKADGLVIVTFAMPEPPTAAGPAPLKVGTLLVSKFASPNSTDATPYDPYSLLRSLEDLFGLSHLAGAGAAGVKSFAPPLLGENGGD
jgi:hypothetical protein